MATHKDFEREFAALSLDHYEFWTKEDLQLAAQLGKTLLERNKELETSLRQYQTVIDEQAQEIEYLTKQSTALRKTNDNRIRIYEQLEVSIQELERANQRLALDNSTDKKKIKSLCAYRDVLEGRCEELQKALEEARVQQTIQKAKLRRLSSSRTEEEGEEENATEEATNGQTPATEQISNEEEKEDLISQMSFQNQELKSQMSRDQRKIADLEEELCRTVQDMALMEEELSQREEQVNSLREKISNLEELRSENLCAKCLKEVIFNMQQEHHPNSLETEEESLSDSHKYGVDTKENSYRTLTDMYEYLVQEQLENKKLSMELSKSSPLNCLSLEDELKSFNKAEERKEEDQRKGKTSAADFSEVETTSSGYSDETSNKSTQTERNIIPGSFLCSIDEGNDCKFSIYDDACPIESRFRKTPEYRTLFREIFAVLKRAAEAKDNGEKLPLLDDVPPVMPKVPPVTPATENLPVDFEDLQSLPESYNQSETASKLSSSPEPGADDALISNSQEMSSTETEPSKRDISKTNDFLEYLSISVGVKKKSGRKSHNSPARKTRVNQMVKKIEGSGSPVSPKKSGRTVTTEMKAHYSPRSGFRSQSPVIRPHVLTTLERKETSPNSRSKPTSSWFFQPFVSTAAQEVAKLKKLEKSYAEVLRQNPVPKSFSRVKSFD